MKKGFLLFIGLLFDIILLYGQMENFACKCCSFDSTFLEPNLYGEVMVPVSKTNGAQFFLNWDDARILLSSKEVIYAKSISYNGYVNELIWSLPDNRNIKLDISRIDEIYFTGYKKLYRKIYLKTKNELISRDHDSIPIFGELLLDGKLSLYVYHRYVKSNTEVQYINSKMISIDDIEYSPKYLIKLPGKNDFIELSYLNKHALYNIFSGHIKEVKSLLKENEISINSERDFVMALLLISKTLY